MKQATEEGERLLAGLADELLGEIGRYLETVQLFRELGCEPHWLAEARSSDLVERLQSWLEPCEPRVSAA
jgi:hypothetical protein